MKLDLSTLDDASFRQLFIGALFFKVIVQSALDKRQTNHIKFHRDEVPSPFSNSVTLEEHSFATDYTLTKLRAGSIFRLINTALLLFWTAGGGIDKVYKLNQNFSLFGTLTQGVTFFLLLGLISEIVSLPQELIETFVIEEKFQKNKTTLKLFIIDKIKGIGIALLMGVPLLYTILFVVHRFENIWWIFSYILIIGFQILMLWAYPTLIAPLFNKFTPLQEGETKEKIINLLARTGFKSKGLFVMDASKRSTHGNAYFSGLGKAKRIVFFDTLLEKLTPPEMEAVLAHELGHFKKKHILKMIAASSLFLFVQFFVIGQLIKHQNFFIGHGVHIFTIESGLALTMMVFPIYTFLLTPIMAAWSRKHEYEADHFAAEQSNAEELVAALLKLHKENSSVLYPDSTYSSFYYSHPPAIERISNLRKIKDELLEVSPVVP